MAAVDKWRTSLNETSFCKKIRENNATESKLNAQLETKGLTAVNDNDLFIWDNSASYLICYNLLNLAEISDRKTRFQILQCTDSPKFPVEWLVWNTTKTHLALLGQLGITVLELPQKWGKYAEFEGGKDIVACKSVSVGEYYFSSHQGVRLLQLSWHPGSSTDKHIVILTSDNLISVYDILDPGRLAQTIYLGDNEPVYGLSMTRPSSISGALGDYITSFDFGPSVEVERKASSYRASKAETQTVWPIYCVRGNGDVIVAYSDLSNSAVKLPVQGPLLMSPPAEDNYGTDACSILCLQTTPTVVVITTCDGRLHHCVLLPRDPEDTALQSESSCTSVSKESCLYQPPEEMLLYVYETVELELYLTTPAIQDAQSIEDIFTCPIRLTKDWELSPFNVNKSTSLNGRFVESLSKLATNLDPDQTTGYAEDMLCSQHVVCCLIRIIAVSRDICSPDRYHCSHAAGVHTVVLPWIIHFQRFCTEENDEDMLPSHKDSVVEHLICTKPLQNSLPSPVLGLSQVKDTAVGTILLALSSDYEFHCLRLSDMRYTTNDTTLQSTVRGRSLPSPLRKISREPFDDRIRKILQRKTSNPLLKSGMNTQMSQQESFQLLSRATQVFREEYIQKQDLARQEIERRVSTYQCQRELQEKDIQSLQESRNILSNNAEQLAIGCEECKEKQEDILRRIESIMRKLQARIPFLSDSERSMKRELENIEERLETYKNSLKQLEVKKDYQQRQTKQGRKSNQPSPLIKEKQMFQLKEVLKQEGDELTDMMKKLQQLKMESNVR